MGFSRLNHARPAHCEDPRVPPLHKQMLSDPIKVCQGGNSISKYTTSQIINSSYLTCHCYYDYPKSVTFEKKFLSKEKERSWDPILLPRKQLDFSPVEGEGINALARPR